jgi:2-polyprenyl-6-methoxyphenol hydroxylase-like FAD-dependent oxidoreductase
VHATGNFAYVSTHCSGERYLMLGDAFAFIDPMFSSGFYLAMHSAFDAADVVAVHLDGTTAEAAKARKRYEKTMRLGPREYSWFIYRVTNPTIRDMFMHPKNVFKVKQGLMSLLAADLGHGWRFRLSLLMFTVVYYAISLANWRRTRAGWQRHRFNIRDMGLLRGETIVRADAAD